MDSFINIRLNTSNIDLYHIRSTIFKTIMENAFYFNGRLLDIGCGQMPYKKYILENSGVEEYVGLDIATHLDYNSVRPDITWNGKEIPSEPKVFDCAIATEVLEHVHEPNLFFAEVFRVLKKGSVFFFTTPFLWPLHEVPCDEYRFTPFSIDRLLKDAGFSQVTIQSLGGWDASLAQMIGLWILRRPNLNSFYRKLLSILAFPLISYLHRIDNKPKMFPESQMITGLSGFAWKKSD
jgi:SAM-dependent methyltransferase